MKKILFVDEDKNLQNELLANIQSFDKHWDCCFALSGDEALQALSSATYAVVVSSLTLPDMPGTALIEQIKQNNPGIARIVMADASRMEQLMHSTSTAHQFLSKPFKPASLLSAIERACRVRSLLGNKVMQEVAGNIDTLPSLPQLYMELSQEINKGEDCTLKTIADIVTHDISMSAKILQITNSAYFGFRRKVETAEQAVKLLGAEMVRSITLVNTLGRAYPATSEVLGQDWLWQHSFAVGVAAQALAASEGAGQHIQSQAFQAGVLHDIGKLILATKFPAEYMQAVKLARDENIAITEAERKLFDCDHGQIGAYLLGLWGLPDGIVEAVAFHHVPVIAQLTPKDMTPLIAVYAADLCVDYCRDASRFHSGPSASEGLASIGRFAQYDRWMQIVACADRGSNTVH